MPTRYYSRSIVPVAVTFLCLGLSQDVDAQASAGQQPPDQQRTVFAESSWVVTPFIGVGFSGDIDSATGLFGAALGYVWNDRTAFEGEVSLLPSSETSGVVEADNTVFNVTANMLYHFTSNNRFVPYAAIGMGLGHANADVTTPPAPTNFDESSTKFVFNFGGGVKRRVSDRLAFRGDLRYIFGGDLVPDYWRATAGLGFVLGR